MTARAEPGPALEESREEGAPGPEAPPGSPGEVGSGEGPSLIARGMEVIEGQHAMISNGIIASAEWIDSFFSDPRIEAEAQKTRLRLGTSLFAEHDTGIEYDSSAHFRLSLPAASRRLQVQISGDEDDDSVLEPERNRPEAQESKGIMAGLRYFFKRTDKRNSSIKASLRLRDGNPAILLEPRFRQDFHLDSWLLRFTQRVVGYSDGDLQVRTIFNLERPLQKKPTEFFLRSNAEGAWYNDRDGYFYHLDLQLFQKLNSRQAIEYAWVNQFQTAPSSRLEAVRLSIAWRQKLKWDWLFLEAVPQLAFPRERNWEPTPGILVNLEMVLGAYEQEGF